MLRVALTGGVGSGKSAAAAMLRKLGAHVSQSDEVGRAMMQPGLPIYDAIRNYFGPSVLLPTGELDRAALAAIAFQQGRVEELNAIVHPQVIAAQAKWMESLTAADPDAVAVVESALVFETRHGEAGVSPLPWATRFDRIVVVTAPEELRRMRYIQRTIPMSAEIASADFNRRIRAQWSDEQKAALADFVLPNRGSLEELQDRVDELYRSLQTEAGNRACEAM